MSRRLWGTSIFSISQRASHPGEKIVKRINFHRNQVGIVSLGAGCGDYRFPALYTRVTKVHRHDIGINKLSKDRTVESTKTDILKGHGLDQESYSQLHSMGQQLQKTLNKM